MQISCVVPVYNNEPTIKHLLTVLLKSDHISEVIAVDDGSSDQSAAIMASLQPNPKLKTLANRQNRGKGYTVVKGIQAASGDVIFICDADLAGLKLHHVENMVHRFKQGDADMVIAAHETLNNPLTSLTGERIFWRHQIEDFLPMIAQAGNGLEQIVNYAHRDKKVAMIVNHHIGHVLKYERGNLVESVREYIQEAIQLAKTELKLSHLSTISTFHRLKRKYAKIISH